MRIDRNSRQYAEILAKYLSGEMSGAESYTFETENFDSEEDKIDIGKMKKQWTAMEGYQYHKIPHAREAWDKLHERLQDEKLIPEQSVVAKTIFMHKLVGIAAIALVLVGIGVAVYVSVTRKPAVEMVQVNTGNEANTLIKTLADGSVIYIAQNSLFSFPEKFESGSRNVELKGEAFFDVAPNPGKPFIIETNEALVQVLGTAFNVKTKNGEGFELVVDRGKVKVTLKKDPSHSEMVLAGEKVSTTVNSLVKSKLIAGTSTSWYKQRMHFKDEELQNIINVLNRNFNTTFVLADKETGKHKLTVTFHNETVETMTELICLTLNLKSQNIHGSVVLSEDMEDAKRY